ncbi:hypothetical protein [Caulobacter sp. 17J80-11]|uniref:hypothetical protein n=1 Tax=Caulobacter sp. 17J80-11 TaxID=2763502 RepID=UPI001653D891|nr:hypothetical protein [Caulobacter sp. 17J80-11]MBC6982124.1 hypothetical protein [Caulobacter sp. 17J80-11]
MAAKLERLRRLLWEDWDPIGVNTGAEGGPSDEYDSYAGQLAGVGRELGIDELEAYLDWAVAEHMGLSEACERNREIAERAYAVIHDPRAWLAIHVSSDELNLLRALPGLPDAVTHETTRTSGGSVLLLEAEPADVLRKRLLDEVLAHGFDEDCALTPDGTISDALAAKLFRALSRPS